MNLVKKIFIFFSILTLLIFIVANVSVAIVSKGFIFSSIDDLPDREVAILLGASVYQDGGLTRILEDRVETAIDLYKTGKVQKILVTGDNRLPEYNEVIPVRNYLREREIPEEDIFVDFAGFDTYDSIYRARDVFLVQSAVVVTQAFHQPRSIFIARSLGVDSVGITSDKRKYSIKNNARESLAVVKAFFNVLFNSDPEFLGDVLPIYGDGRMTIPEAS